MWAAAALMAKEGMDAVRIEPLAVALKVTKGSFYWHFEDRKALHLAILELWEQEATRRVVQELEETGGDAGQKLTNLIKLATERESQGIDTAGFEMRIRDWVARTPEHAERIVAVDERRIAYVRHLLGELGANATRANVLSRMLYMTLLGYYSATRYQDHTIGYEAMATYVQRLIKHLRETSDE